MLKAIQMILEAKKKSNLQLQSGNNAALVVDLHPSRPDYRRVKIGTESISLEADPTFAEIEAAGATIVKNSTPHTLLDDFFLISGEIPRVTPYEIGLKNGIRFHESTKSWVKDELISDERFLMWSLEEILYLYMPW